MSPFIISDEFIQKLIDGGIVPKNTSRVVIDARVGYAVELHFCTVEFDSERIDVLVAAVSEVQVVKE